MINSSASTYDVIVLGLGVVGSAAAYHLARAGHRTLALEQFELDHRLGSSYGESRIIRYAYDETHYVAMAKKVFPMWRELEAVSGKSLMKQVGGIDFGYPDRATLTATRDALQAAGIPFEWLTRDEAARRFPQFKLDDGMVALVQADAAFLRASECVLAQTERARHHGAEILTNTPVERIEPLNNAVRVHTPRGTFEAGRLALAAGPWMPKVLGALGLNMPLRPFREQVVFFKAADRAMFEPGRFPVFIAHSEPWYYGLPDVDGNGFKAAIHIRNEEVDPDNMKRTPDEAYVAHMHDWVRHYIPSGAGEVSEARICLYTMTPDQHFLIDRHPNYPHIAFAGGMSGHGFKFGLLTGQYLAELATEGRTADDISLFSAKRFASERRSGA
jgi:monomeric sarcosine oxidase